MDRTESANASLSWQASDKRKAENWGPEGASVFWSSSSQHPERAPPALPPSLCWRETPHTAFHSELGKALTRVKDSKNLYHL